MLEGHNGVGRGWEVVLRVARDVEDGAGGPGHEGEQGDGGYLDVAEGGSYTYCLGAKRNDEYA